MSSLLRRNATIGNNTHFIYLYNTIVAMTFL